MTKQTGRWRLCVYDLHAETIDGYVFREPDGSIHAVSPSETPVALANYMRDPGRTMSLKFSLEDTTDADEAAELFAANAGRAVQVWGRG